MVKDRSSLSTPQKKPTPRVTGEWGWKDGWFSEVGLLAATEDRVLLSLYGGGV